jgi:hypothetical protein
VTKQGSFKRAARQRAREFGIRYSTARAELEMANRQAFVNARLFERDALKAHLEAQYGVRITSLAPIDDDPATRPRDSWPGHYPSTLYVKRTDGTPWIARIYSSSADQISRPMVANNTEDEDGDGISNEIPISIVDHLEFYFLNYFKPGTYELQVALNSRSNSANAATFGLNFRSSLSAMTFPFGPTGTNATSAAGALNVAADELELPQRRQTEE